MYHILLKMSHVVASRKADTFFKLNFFPNHQPNHQPPRAEASDMRYFSTCFQNLLPPSLAFGQRHLCSQLAVFFWDLKTVWHEALKLKVDTWVMDRKQVKVEIGRFIFQLLIKTANMDLWKEVNYFKLETNTAANIIQKLLQQPAFC